MRSTASTSPAKLDFELASFVANKLTHALPGTVWIQSPLEWTLQYPDLIIASVWIWTLAELAVGLGLIFGLGTRLFALISIGLNISLMLIFGWMGSTCLDEWTMAVSGLAMSSAVFLAGGGTWSLDSLIGRTGWAEPQRLDELGVQRAAAAGNHQNAQSRCWRRSRSCSPSAATTSCSAP